MDKSLWKAFYKEEMKLFRWMNDNAEVLFSYDDNNGHLHYQEWDNEVLKPPRYIRGIYLVPDLDEAYLQFSPVKAAFKRAVTTVNKDKTVNFPRRFPKFISHAESINVTINNAVKSVKIDGSKKQASIMSYDLNDEDVLMSDLSVLKGIFKSADFQYHSKIQTFSLLVDSNELLNYFGAKVIQKRIETGNQYRARVLETSGQPTRYSLGFLIVDRPVLIQHSLSREKRNDQLSKNDLVTLPIDLPYDMYVKEYK